ncbi:MAG: peptidoglycan-binding domain-containing protein [Candidatus Electrothrix sp. YB6]
MKNRKILQGMIGAAVVTLAVFVFAGPGYSRSGCSSCRTCQDGYYSPQPRPQIMDDQFSGLKYRDGFPGPRRHKRQQVKKLQCMLTALGYCSGPIDGWYGKATARGVMLYLADTFRKIGHGKRLSPRHWDHLVNWVGSRCTKYDRKPMHKRYKEYYNSDYNSNYKEYYYKY